MSLTSIRAITTEVMVMALTNTGNQTWENQGTGIRNKTSGVVS